MANHLGIELVSSFCRIVALEGRAGLFRRRSGERGRIRGAYEVPYHPASPGQLTEELRRLGVRGQAQVAVWGLKGVHRLLSLPPADPADMEAMARREAGAVDRNAEASDGVMLGGPAVGGQRQVTYVSVPAAEVRASLRPLIEAGIEVAGVVTPAQVHARLAQERLGAMSDQEAAVLALQGRVTGLTVVRRGAVLFARELPWGYETERAVAGGAQSGVDEFAGRVASELRRSLVYLRQQHQADVSRVLLCGDLPDLRSLTGPLMHDLGLDVETLDSPDGLDLTNLPEPADALRSRLGVFRPALALASSEAPTVNLLPRGGTTVRRRLTTGNRPQLLRAVAVGLIAAVLGWGIVELLARSARTRTDSLRREIALLEPEVQRLEANRQARATDAARAAALDAFASEGPRLARLLAALGEAAPAAVAISSLEVTPGAGTWNVSVKGQSLAPTPAEAQEAFNRFVKAVNASDDVGVASQAPEIKVHIEEPEPEAPEPAPVAVLTASERALRQTPMVVEPPRERWTYVNGRQVRIILPRVAQPRPRNVQPLEAPRYDVPTPEPVRERKPPKYAGAVLDFTLRYEVRK